MACASCPRGIGSLPSASDRSALMVRNSGLSGRGCGLAVDTGRSTATSTVESGAATMKMMSSTSMTSMNGVTLISCSSEPSSSSPLSRRAAMAHSAALAQPDAALAAVEIARDEAQHLGRGVAHQRPIAGDRACELIVDDDRGDGGEQADGGGQQRLGDAGRDHGEVGGLRLGDADEAVHDAPHRAEQADERRRGADGGEHAGALVHVAAGRDLEPRQARGDALLDAALVGEVGGQPQLEHGRIDQRRQDAARATRGGRAHRRASARSPIAAQRPAQPAHGRPAARCSWRATPSTSRARRTPGRS